jgi:hypothetical protein
MKNNNHKNSRNMKWSTIRMVIPDLLFFVALAAIVTFMIFIQL